MKIPPVKIYFSESDINTINERMKEVLQSGMLTLGKYGRQFEEEFAKYIGTKYAITTNSGTSSIEMIIRSLNIKNKNIIIPTNTFFATAEAVIHSGNKIKFVDCGADYNINYDKFLKAMDKQIGAVIVVHIGGYVSRIIHKIKAICTDYDIPLIEDAAHAHGSECSYLKKKAGNIGVANAFSFYPTKIMTSGEGGMITTNEESIANQCKILRDQGKAGFLGNVHTDVGYNWRMSEPNAIIGLQHMKRLSEFVEKRRMIGQLYDSKLKHTKLKPVKIDDITMTNYYKYVCTLPEGVDRSKLKKTLKEKYGISLTGEVYELPVHLQPIMHTLYKTKKGDFPISEELCKRQVCLPIYHTMTINEIDYVVDSLNNEIS